MTNWQTRAGQLADGLVDRGAIRDPAWRAVVATTPRHLFVPRFYALDEFNQPRTLVDGVGEDTVAGWLEAVYQDQALVTHYAVLGAMPDGREVRAATSSASMPHVVAVMLDRLQVEDGNKVLEIGTGTGYNAALLCRRLGDQRVTSVELDEATMAEAAAHLAGTGHQPTLVVGDGAAGAPDQAPFDRIIVTCSIGYIPAAWLGQLAPGGRIVAPFTFGSALAVLDRTDDDCLTGRIDPELVGFMQMRGPGHQPPLPEAVRRPDGVPYRGLTTVDPHLVDPLGEQHDLRLWLALHLPGTDLALSCADDGTPEGIVLTAADSYAAVPYQTEAAGAWPVTQLGSRRLWDTVETACAEYERNGRPTRDRIGMTVRVDGYQCLWLDEADGPYSWPMPL